MNKNEIIKAINEIYELEVIGTDFNMDTLVTAVINCDYYVRPGDERKEFMNRFNKIMQENNGFKSECEMSWYERFGLMMGMIDLVKTSFNQEYFESQLAILEEPLNKDFIKNHLNELTRKQLEKFITFVIDGRLNYGLFISNTSSTNMWEEMNRRCVRKNPRIPRLDRRDYGAFCSQHPLYFFDCLSKKVIVDVLCDYIDKDATLMETAVVTFRNSGIAGLRKCVDEELQRRKQIA